jgi:NAD(P)-dependent dehydrogenase (short-subunit alcohol dehydrogenase family)
MRPIREQVILITGATDGLGRAVAGELAAAGATVLLHGRDAERGRQAIDEIRARSGNEKLGWYEADFSSLDEVRSMAEQVIDEQRRLDVLVNNAGIGTTLPGGRERMESKDGYELRFAVNYLAGFLLTRLLKPLLLSSAPARIVNVSSAGQMPIDFSDVMLERGGYSGTRAYCQSKLAQVMFTFDLAEELRGTGVTANCLHPATYMPTKIVLSARGSALSTLEEGVQATMRLISASELDEISGRYFNGVNEARADEQAYDADARLRLRELSEHLVGLSSRRA